MGKWLLNLNYSLLFISNSLSDINEKHCILLLSHCISES